MHGCSITRVIVIIRTLLPILNWSPRRSPTHSSESRCNAPAYRSCAAGLCGLGCTAYKGQAGAALPAIATITRIGVLGLIGIAALFWVLLNCSTAGQAWPPA